MRRRTFWSDALWKLRHDPVTIAALATLGLLILIAASADLLAEHFFQWSYAQQDLLNAYQRPTGDDPAFWLGGDQLGRSQLVRLLEGARVSLFIGCFGAAVSLGLGVLIGMTAGYFGGWWDDIVVWLVTTLYTIPTLFLLIIVGVLFRLQPVSLAVLIGLLGWMAVANLARGQTIALRNREYVQAARLIGASDMRIVFRHLLPNILPLMIVVATIGVGTIMLTESSLSYLGFGIQPPVPSWGNMLTGAQLRLSRAPWLVFSPGSAIALTVLCFYLVGDGLRDALDPRVRGRR